jgi:hypothetical protein
LLSEQTAEKWAFHGTTHERRRFPGPCFVLAAA